MAVYVIKIFSPCSLDETFTSLVAAIKFAFKASLESSAVMFEIDVAVLT